ncbi:2-polyprenyl-6-methoxyphenol hydroxylase [Actinopolyspora mzabensis]|uniref:2-polyprenyl-6-methoxyphenol hydroxylase n=1 Tax=Actinopolyspora mzabensis TaxID=995066 RepID=A0A1G8Y3C5_ACTMZ|nr:hypothetical protein [Actinopolyspora mzabensis]SDJ97281.1 2-polyprenyl-6-methoxyphenol hydroxylase [Actinopolyspora mzabensis]
MSGDLGERAVVLGGSIAGVLAARVLAESYREVVVVDRDLVLDSCGPRRGTPQARHAHGLHARGQLIFEELFPGLTAELADEGYPVGDLGEMRWYFNARRLRPARTGLRSVTPPRPVLEHRVRSRLTRMPNVFFREEHDIIEPVADGGLSRIIGVRISSRRSEEGHAGEPEMLPADLVVDATGRGSRTPTWLARLGYPRPAEERVKIGLAYTTRFYRPPSGVFDDTWSINPVASPAHPRGAFFGLSTPDSCVLSLTGMLGDHPPTDHVEFTEFARSLPVPDVYEGIKDAEPIDEPVTFGFPASVRRRYERLKRFPEGLIVIGDAVCSFNPVYGQGMSVAAWQVSTLREQLRAGKIDPGRLMREVGRVVDNPWEISAGGDLAFPGVEGRRTAKSSLGNAYMSRVQHAATMDTSVADGFMRVAGLMDPPSSLMRPRMMSRVLRSARQRPRVDDPRRGDEIPHEMKTGKPES